jgi:hypothetical protein
MYICTAHVSAVKTQGAHVAATRDRIANTAIFSAVNAILLRPLPYTDADRLVMMYEKRAAEGVLDAPGCARGLSRLVAHERRLRAESQLTCL